MYSSKKLWTIVAVREFSFQVSFIAVLQILFRTNTVFEQVKSFIAPSTMVFNLEGIN
jgi:hypothetical protein